jgi:hypothetical protein
MQQATREGLGLSVEFGNICTSIAVWILWKVVVDVTYFPQLMCVHGDIFRASDVFYNERG